MTLLFCDGFDTGDAALKWGGLSTSASFNPSPAFVTNTPYNAGKAISFPYQGQNNYVRLYQSIPGGPTTLYIGFAFNQSGPGQTMLTNFTTFLRLQGDSSTTDHIYFGRSNGGGPLLWYRAPGTVLGSLSITPVLGKWYFIEARITLSSTVGEITTRIDGNLDTSLTNINTRNGGTSPGLDTLSIGPSSGTGSDSWACYFDDFYLSVPGGNNPGFLGPIRIQTLSPNAAGSDTGLTPTSGSNYQNVSDVNPASYNYSSVVGTRDTYALPDLVVGTSQVLAVRNVLTGQNSDAGAGGFKPVVRSGSIYYDPTVTVGSTSRVYSQAVRETDPATGAAWTVAGVNALQVGAEVS